MTLSGEGRESLRNLDMLLSEPSYNTKALQSLCARRTSCFRKVKQENIVSVTLCSMRTMSDSTDILESKFEFICQQCPSAKLKFNCKPSQHYSLGKVVEV